MKVPPFFRAGFPRNALHRIVAFVHIMSPVDLRNIDVQP